MAEVEAPRRPRVLLGACGSVASVKVAQLATQLAACYDVRVVRTEAAERFACAAERYDAPGCDAIRGLVSAGWVREYKDADEWDYASVRGDPVVHIELRKWADVLLVAPLSANTLAKLANGLCDNLLTSVARAWDPAKPIILAPAMNTFMWNHPLTARHLAAVTEIGATVVQPAVKTLACGDTGTGALAPVDTILAAVTKVAPPRSEIQPARALARRAITPGDRERADDLLARHGHEGWTLALDATALQNEDRVEGLLGVDVVQDVASRVLVGLVLKLQGGGERTVGESLADE